MLGRFLHYWHNAGTYMHIRSQPDKQMKHLFTFIFIISLYGLGHAQNLDTGKGVSYLDSTEAKVIYLMNLARHDGSKFIKDYLEPYVKSKDKQGNRYVKSLYEELRKTKGVAPLLPSKKLTDAALYHAKDMGTTGQVGHDSSDGTSFKTRIHRYVPGAAAENCSYGRKDAISIVMQLLIDNGVPSLGHRKTILSPLYKYVGVAIEPHKKYRYNCVQDFAGRSQ